MTYPDRMAFLAPPGEKSSPSPKLIFYVRRILLGTGSTPGTAGYFWREAGFLSCPAGPKQPGDDPGRRDLLSRLPREVYQKILSQRLPGHYPGLGPGHLAVSERPGVPIILEVRGTPGYIFGILNLLGSGWSNLCNSSDIPSKLAPAGISTILPPWPPEKAERRV